MNFYRSAVSGATEETAKKPFTIKVLNTNQIVHSMEELILAAGEFV